MAKIKWTEEQLQAIKEKDSNILVAAAAGSGKTAVLVNRIIDKIINEKIDIDKLLVVTFTNSAASEMRERILDAIYEKLEEDSENEHLQKQILLLGKANICTIHSFCLEVIKNNFYEIDISPNFRIGDTAEIELLKQEVLDELFEEKYINADKNFLKLIDIYTGYRSDDPLKEIILNIYRYIQSNPFPIKWLDEKVEMFNIKNVESDFSNTIWGEILLNEFEEEILTTKIGLEKVKKVLSENIELEKFILSIKSDIEKLEDFLENIKKWDNAYEFNNKFSFNKWPVDRKISSNIKDEAKIIRDKIKKNFDTQRNKILITNSKEANKDILDMYENLRLLKELIIEFSEKFALSKKEKNIIDFNDIEHFALEILIAENEEKEKVPSDVAKKYQEKFNEIAIDEYQDSNIVQEYILNAISNNNNIFMVGDVKQSIYKFRQARPELFLEKYKKYKLKDEKKEKDNLKIQLFKNFRSRKNILDLTNIVFENIMSNKLGDIDYNTSEYLNLGSEYVEPEDENITYAGKAELHILNLKENNESDECEYKNNKENKNNVKFNIDDDYEVNERIENTTLEAKFVANKIKELINSNYKIYDKNVGYRNITYKDIVILLRATSIASPVYEKELTDLNIPVFSDTSSEYLDSIEMQTMISLLKIIDNPIQDIPLVTVLRSMIGGFTDNDLIEIRLADKNSNFYEVLLKSKIQVSEELKNKIDVFITNLNKWQDMSKYLSLDELIWEIYIDTGYYNYVRINAKWNN